MAGSGLRVDLLGGFRVTRDGHQVTGIRTARQQALLAYLVLRRDQPQPRQRLAFLFWPDSDEAQALTNLRRELHHLRRALPESDACLDVSERMLRWRPDAPCAVDVRLLEEAIGRAYPDGQPPVREALEEAVALYPGDLLPDSYDDWVLEERERLRQRCVRALEDLAELLEARRAYADAARHARRLLQLDPLHEATYRRLMRLLALNGDRAAAVQLYHVCATTLQRGLGVHPDAATQDAYRRLLELETSGAPGPAPGAASTLVGREKEWRHLLGAWRRAAAGESVCCVIYGEAGIGKTRLAEEFLSWCAAQRIPAVRSRSYAAEGRLAYSPIAEWLRAPALKAGLVALEEVWRAEIARLLPELAADRPGLAPSGAPPEGWERRRLFEALARGALATTPLVLFLDDLQWCDRDSLEWLRFLLRFDPTAPLLLLGTVRTEEQADNPTLSEVLLALRQSGQCEEIELASLGEAEATALAQQTAERRLDAPTLADVFRRTQGHPLFLVEFIRAGLPFRDGADDRTRPATLPPRVQAVIAARLAQLSPPARDLAGLAAAIGREFRLDVIREASDLEEPELIRALDELWRRRILREQAADAYDFSHDRIRDVAYAEVALPKRRLLHRRIAQALELLYATELDAASAQIASQYEQAGVPARAIQFYERAAREDTRLSASEGAIQHFRKALALLHRLPESAQRDRRELSLQLALTAPLNAVSGYATPEIEAALERVRALGERLGDTEAVMRCLWGLCGMQFVRGNIREQHTLATTFYRLAQKDGRFLIDSLHLLAGGLASAGALAQARDYFEQAIALYDFAHPRPTPFGSNLGVFLLAWESHTLWLLGYPDLAAERCLRAVAIADDLGHPYSQVLVRAYAAVLFQLRGETERSLAHAEEVHELCRKYSFVYYAEWCDILRAWARSGTEPAGALVGEIEAALDRLRAIHAETRRPYFLALLAEVHARAGRRAQAEAVVDAALATAAHNGDVWWTAELYRLKGEFGSPEAAEPLFLKALDVAQSQAAKSLELRAALSLARRWAAGGRHDEARALLAPVFGWFTEGFETPDLRDARAALSQTAPIP
ncbi:MAG TPA: AAA family ATPase [bacterium]|nr:AAA family ATPase [bacterium]